MSQSKGLCFFAFSSWNNSWKCRRDMEGCIEWVYYLRITIGGKRTEVSSRRDAQMRFCIIITAVIASF
jgi:hypothetical protein